MIIPFFVGGVLAAAVSAMVYLVVVAYIYYNSTITEQTAMRENKHRLYFPMTLIIIGLVVVGAWT